MDCNGVYTTYRNHLKWSEREMGFLPKKCLGNIFLRAPDTVSRDTNGLAI